MNISRLISDLEELKDNFGDLPVVVKNDEELFEKLFCNPTIGQLQEDGDGIQLKKQMLNLEFITAF